MKLSRYFNSNPPNRMTEKQHRSHNIFGGGNKMTIISEINCYNTDQDNPS